MGQRVWSYFSEKDLVVKFANTSINQVSYASQRRS